MKVEIAPHERMSETGSSLIRLIQSNELPTLDLLIREAIQNSSDAVKEEAESVKVAFNISNFESNNLSRHFEKISETLNEQFKNETSKYLEIRDTNTTGLTGPLHHNDVEDNELGNLINLVYEISKPQQKVGAGGSWGLGKTIYFRVGVGLVIYYTRILNENNEYESRLAACLVEDEKKDNSLLPIETRGPRRGIAWWGAPRDEKHTIPITNENEINEILKDANVEPFKKGETGTSIIIPYIDEEKLVQSAKASYEEAPTWTNNIEKYIKRATERWYSPRINNNCYAMNKPLLVSINGKEINPNEMLPLFRVMQDLYNKSSYALKNKSNILLEDKQLNLEKIFVRKIFKTNGEAGEIIFTKLSKADLLMLPPYNYPSHYDQAALDVSGEVSNPPMIGYLRKPGMIINYDIEGDWASSIQTPSEEEFVVALFVPNSRKELSENYNSILLEEYLRMGEKADHTSWNDQPINEKNPKLVSKIKGQVARKINQYFVPNKDKEKNETKQIKLGKSLANILLPPEDFGKRTNGEVNKGNGGGQGRVKSLTNKSSLSLLGDPKFSNGEVHSDFEIIIGKSLEQTTLELRVITENGTMTSEKWEDDKYIGTAFPLIMTSFYISKIEVDNKAILCEKVHDFTKELLDLNEVTISSKKTNKYQINSGIEIHKKIEESCVIYGTVSFKGNQNNVKGSLTIFDKVGVK
ncbi:hypothetical protein SAMN05421781_0299 [Marinococcus luteus]|uniref:Histidine kinase-, DNA gyrase B-, and HSP90-like ATPase n=1 Tax=Marinococcus luteus TaxID=1122204 RepID=A0A1H2QGF5_9BACI|nr:hypothetical protein [Marinococcus luteus]SDW05948.1 hypothetical protein SAMN05421781_0299 [Marinococcus luteus]